MIFINAFVHQCLGDNEPHIDPQSEVWLEEWNIGDVVESRDVQAAYMSYERKATYLKDSKQMVELKDEVLGLYEALSRDSPMKFIGIGAPSGSGKTQTAFTLATYPCFKVVHVCLTTISNRSQHVYNHYRIKDVSKALLTQLKADFRRLTRSISDVGITSATALMSTRLSVVLVLSRLFGIQSSQGTLLHTPNEFHAALLGLLNDAAAQRPVMIVDEAYLQGGKRYACDLAVLLRSILRACGVASIFMGTTINMVSFIGGPESTDMSTGNPGKVDWATLITVLPNYIAVDFNSSLILSEEVREFVVGLIENYPHVNPRNLDHLCQAAVKSEESTTLDVVLKDVAQLLYNGKTVLRSVEGVRAQVHFLLGAVTTEKYMRVLVGKHFARYEANLTVFLEGSDVKAIEKETEILWPPVPTFPTSKIDPLLSLLLGGPCSCALGRHPSPFVFSSKSYHLPTSLTSAAALLLSHNYSARQAEASRTNLTNANAQSRNGNMLECIVTLACINASRACGVQGAPVLDFLLHLAMELQPTVLATDLEWADTEAAGRLFKDLTDRVPYCTRVHDDVDSVEGKLNLKLSCYVRPENQSMIDGYVSDSF